MIKIELRSSKEKIKRDCPTNWRDVSFKKFLEISENNDSIFKVYSILLEVEEEVIKKIDLGTFNQLATALSFLNDKKAFDNVQIKDSYTVLDTEFFFNKDLTKESFFCYEDWKSEFKDVENEDGLKLLPITLAYFLRPKDEEYAQSVTVSRVPLFEQMNCVDAVTLFNFFLQRSSESQRNFNISILKQNLKNQSQVWIGSTLLVLMLPFTVLLKAIFLLWMMWVKNPLEKFIYSSFMKRFSGNIKRNSRTSKSNKVKSGTLSHEL